jgi:GNAT superfamily N-acetyltransferase
VTQLVPITHVNWRAAAAMRVRPGQLQFIAGYEPIALVILSKAFVRLGDVDWWPYLVQDTDVAIGALALPDERRRNRQMTLFHLFVDAHHQGNGYGRAAVRLVLDLTRHLEGCERLQLTGAERDPPASSWRTPYVHPSGWSAGCA